MNLFLISNMYPSSANPTFGVFVQKFERGITEQGEHFTQKAIISRRSATTVQKFCRYGRFFVDIFNGITKRNYDIIYVHYILQTALLLFPFLPFIRRKIILNVHGEDVLPRHIFHKCVAKYLLPVIMRKSALVVVPSGSFKEIVLKKFNVKPEKVFISPSGGVNFDVFNETTQVGSPLRQYDVGYVSRIDAEKGWDTYIEAIRIFKIKYPQLPLKALMVGNGDESAKKDALIEKYQLAEVIQSIDSVDQKGLARVFNNINLMVFPTRLPESLGLVGLEALACGTPVIGSDMRSLKDYITEGINGFIFHSNAPEELATKIYTYLTLDLKSKIIMSQNAIKKAAEFEKRSISKNLYKKLEEVCVE